MKLLLSEILHVAQTANAVNIIIFALLQRNTAGSDDSITCISA